MLGGISGTGTEPRRRRENILISCPLTAACYISFHTLKNYATDRAASDPAGARFMGLALALESDFKSLIVLVV